MFITLKSKKWWFTLSITALFHSLHWLFHYIFSSATLAEITWSHNNHSSHMTTNLYLLMHAQQPRTEKTAEINRSTFGINLIQRTQTRSWCLNITTKWEVTLKMLWQYQSTIDMVNVFPSSCCMVTNLLVSNFVTLILIMIWGLEGFCYLFLFY